MKHTWFTIVLALCLALSLTSSAGLAQEGAPGTAQPAPKLSEDVRNYIPVQGRLTNADGKPLTGIYPMTFTLYDAESGGTEICHDSNGTVQVTNGLFYSEIYGTCAYKLTGQQVWLGIKVATDAEMTPRQPIYAVPYAWSLHPGAEIIGSDPGQPILHVENTGDGGRGLRAYATSATGTNYGVVGGTNSSGSYGGYFYNTGAGTGVWAQSNSGTAAKAESTSGTGISAQSGNGVAVKAESTSGVAIQATGTGIIQSSALSYVWVSGNGLRPFSHSDSTYIDLDSVGGAKIFRGATAGNKNVMLPITITAPLYGQNVKVTGLDIYYRTDTDLDGIAVVLMRRQINACEDGVCYATILDSRTTAPPTPFLTCPDTTAESSCIKHFNLTSNNILTSTSGALYLTLEMSFSSASTWVNIGSIRLTLEHD